MRNRMTVCAELREELAKYETMRADGHSSIQAVALQGAKVDSLVRELERMDEKAA